MNEKERELIIDGSYEIILRSDPTGFSKGLMKSNEIILNNFKVCVKFISGQDVLSWLVRDTQQYSVLNHIADIEITYEQCNYRGGGCTFVRPWAWSNGGWGKYDDRYYTWELAIKNSYEFYNKLVSKGASLSEASSVLLGSLMATVTIETSLRYWKWFFHMFVENYYNDQIKSLTVPLLQKMQLIFPGVFDDIEVDQKYM